MGFASKAENLKEQKKKARVLQTLDSARLESNDSLKIAMYSRVAPHRTLFSRSAFSEIMKEALDALDKSNLKNYSAFQIKYNAVYAQHSDKEREQILLGLKNLLQWSKDLEPKGLAMAKVCYSIGCEYRVLTNFDSAMVYLDEAKTLSIRRKDTFLLGTVIGEIYNCYLKMYDHKKAAEVIEVFLDKYPTGINNAIILSRLATSYYYTSRFDDILKIYQTILDKYSKAEIASRLPSLAMHYCGSLVYLGRYEEAEKELDSYLQLMRPLGREYQLTGMYQHYASLLSKTKKHQRAIETLDSAYKYKLGWMSKTFLARYHKQKAINYAYLGDADSSVIHLKLSEKNLKEYFSENSEKEYAKSLAFYETKDKEQEILLLQKENEIAKGKNWQWRLIFLAGILVLLIFGAIIYNRLKQNQLKAEQAMVTAELTSIRSQMNPHFMFNALNSVKSYIISNKPEAAAEYLSKFASLMRGILDLSSKPFISLQDELNALDLYVEMEEMRFKNRFSFKLKIADNVNTNQLFVPPLFLQPFVENAIKHGLLPLKKRDGELLIEISESNEIVQFKIRDNGVGRPVNDSRKSSHRSKGIGLSKERIAVLNKKLPQEQHVIINDLKDADENPCGTEIIIHLQKKINP